MRNLALTQIEALDREERIDLRVCGREQRARACHPKRYCEERIGIRYLLQVTDDDLNTVKVGGCTSLRNVFGAQHGTGERSDQN